MTNKIIEIKQALRANKLVEDFTNFCIKGEVCARGTVYNALNPNTYDHQSFMHRSIARLAVLYLLDRNIKTDAYTSDFPEVTAA
jgi:hypothetical protein